MIDDWIHWYVANEFYLTVENLNHSDVEHRIDWVIDDCIEVVVEHKIRVLLQ